MLKHYIKFAFRNFRSNKVVFIGSLLTLCLGALCISLLFSYVYNELTMDDFHKREKDIYVVIMKDSPTSEWSAMSPKYYFKFDYKDYPEIESVVNISKIQKNKVTLTYENTNYYPEGIVVDSTFFKIFDFDLIIGNKKNVLNNPSGVLLTKQFAAKIFGNKNPIGKTIKLSSVSETFHTVKGLVNLPSNSSITFDFILPRIKGSNARFGVGTDFILVNKNFDIKTVKNRIENIGKGQPLFQYKKTGIVPLNDMYFRNDSSILAIVFSKVGDIKNVYILIITIIVILIISALNFSNLQIINSNASIKQSAISKVNGAQKHHIIYQKLLEIVLLLIISAIIITLFYKSILPIFNQFTNVELSPDLWVVFLIIGGTLIVIAVLSLIYPLLIAYKIPVIKRLKSEFILGNQIMGRKAILIFQYSLVFILLISSATVTRQLYLMLNKDLGFTDKNVVRTKLYFPLSTSLESRDLNKTSEEQYIYNELKTNSSIIAFSQGFSPLEPKQGIVFKLKGSSDDFLEQNWVSVNTDYEKVFGLKIIEGRFFNNEIESSANNNQPLVINEAAKKFWDIKDISSDRILTMAGTNADLGHEIIGVVKDFNYEHLSVKPRPLIMFPNNDLENDFFIRFEEGKVKEGLQFLEQLFNKINPNETFQYSFISDEIKALYQKEKRLSIIYMVFTTIALLISAIGLFAIALYDTQRRIKEIGIRKVNGATIKEILIMLNKDFVKWVLIAFMIAVPISFYIMKKWLENFAYKTALSWWIFALAGVFTLIIALLTVSWQTYKAATRNPVESLRDE